MLKRKQILTTFVISAAILAPNVNSVFADTQNSQSQIVQSSEQNLEGRFNQVIEQISKIPNVVISDLSESYVKASFGDASYGGKKIVIGNQSFELVVIDKDGEYANAEDQSGKKYIDIITESENTNLFSVDLGSSKYDFSAYYKDGIFIKASSLANSNSKEIVENTFVKILNPIKLEDNQPIETQENETQKVEEKETTTEKDVVKQNYTIEDLINEVIKNSLFTSVEDMNKSQLEIANSSWGKVVTVDGIKFYIGKVDAKNTPESTLSLIQQSQKDFMIGKVVAYYKDGVFVRCAEPAFLGSLSNPNPDMDKAKTILPKIKDIIDNVEFKVEDDIPVIANNDEQTESINLGGAGLSFDDDFGGSSLSSFDNPKTYDNGILAYAGAIGVSIVGMVGSIFTRYKK